MVIWLNSVFNISVIILEYISIEMSHNILIYHIIMYIQLKPNTGDELT